MADKEATVYIVDVSRATGNSNNGRTQTDLEWAMTYAWDKITSIMALERKTTLQAVIALKTDDSSNELHVEDNDGFDHITTPQDLAAISLTDLKRLRRVLVSSDTNKGDAISAIVIAIQMITRICKRLKYKRKIVLITNGLGRLDVDDSDSIAKKIIEDEIELVVLGIDFDDDEYGFKEEDKNPEKVRNESHLRSLTDACNGTFATLAEAIGELGMPRLKSTRAVPSYKDQLTLGKIGAEEDTSTTMVIDVQRYPRTMIRRPPTASSFLQRTDVGVMSTESSDTVLPDADAEAGPSAANPMALVRNTRMYQVIDESKKFDVPSEDLAKGYEYGRTAVHVSESDMSVVRMDTKMSLEIVGFIPSDNYDQFMGLSRTNIIVGQKANTKAIMALSSLIHALFEAESFAIARLVIKDDKPPLLVLVAPLIEPEYECLVEVELPFAEDVRSYKFPPLDRVVTVSGKVLKEHRNIPNDRLVTAMSEYVDQMDISTFGQDDDGEPAEYMPPVQTFSPVLHRIDQAVRFRAVNPTSPIPPPYEILTRYSNPPSELVDKATAYLNELVAASDVKKVPPKAQSRTNKRDAIQPVSGIDVEALLASRTPTLTVSPDNPIPSFKQMLDRTTDTNGIRNAAAQFGKIIEKRIAGSFGDSAHEMVLEEMRVMKEELTDMEDPGAWNGWVEGLKKKLHAQQLGGDQTELWWKIRKEKLGFIEGSRSGVTSDQAIAFLAPGAN